MLVRAKHSVKYDGVWYRPGAEFEISMTDADRMDRVVDIVEAPLHTENSDRIAENEAPVVRGRGRKKSG